MRLTLFYYLVESIKLYLVFEISVFETFKNLKMYRMFEILEEYLLIFNNFMISKLTHF